MAGHEDAGQAALQRAWNAVPAAAAEQGAAARVAADMAVAAGRAANRERLIALLSVDRLNRAANVGQALLSQDVPVCGTAGMTPGDGVAVAFMRLAPPGRPRLALIWASRPTIAAPFLAAIARSPGLEVPDGQASAVVLRCRTSPSEEYRIKAHLDDQIVRWSTSRGAYPLLNTGETADTASLASLLADRERRYGSNSFMLLPVLVRILEPAIAEGMADQGVRKRAAALSHRMADIITSNGAPADIVLLTTLSATGLDFAAQNTSMADALAKFQGLLNQASHDPAVALDTLYEIVNGTTAGSQTPSAFRAQLLEQTIAVIRARATAADRRVSALALRLIAVRREQGDDAAVAALAKTYGFGADLCAVATPPVRFTSSNITADDYPSDLAQTLMQGSTTMEFDIDAKGMAIGPRILVSDPPFAFDTVALAKSGTVSYEPAKTNGVARACRAQVQSIKWQLPY